MPTVVADMVGVGMVGVDTSAEVVRTSAEGALTSAAAALSSGVHGWEALAVIEAEVWLRLGVSAG